MHNINIINVGIIKYSGVHSKASVLGLQVPCFTLCTLLYLDGRLLKTVTVQNSRNKK